MSDLRDRIAAVQARHHHWDYAGALACACGQEFGRFANDGWESAVKGWSYHVADAVIADLGLQRASKPNDYDHVQYPPGDRYITDWISDT